MLLKIEITNEDIGNGNSQCATCPVALAATRALWEAGFSEWWHVEFEPYRAFRTPDGLTFWHYGSGGDTRVAAIPIGKVDGEAYEFASMFDDWYAAQEGGEDEEDDKPSCPGPFTFKVRLPRAVAKAKGTP